MSLLDGGIATAFASVFGSVFLDATLHRQLPSGDDGAGGGPDKTFAPDEAVKAQLDQTTQSQQSDGGYTDTDQRILVLASGVDPITTNDEITVRGVRWAIASVTRDPAGAYYDLRGRTA